MTEFKNIQVEKEAAVAVVTLNRPKVLNALNVDTLTELGLAFSQLKMDSAIKCVVLTGSGDKAFVAGADINQIAELDPVTGARFAARGQRVLNEIENLDKPVIAAVNGYALGGGCEIAMACHIRFASKKAVFGQPEINLGVIPGFGGTQRLARLVGEGRCLELVLSGDSIDAARAFELGLVNRLEDPADLMASSLAFAKKLAQKSAPILRYCMQAVHRGLSCSLEEGLNQEASLFGLCCATADKEEGTSAFLQKRKAQFKDL